MITPPPVASISYVRIGISVDRWHHLNLTDDTFKQWAKGVLPAVRDVWQLVALDEGGTRWRASKYSAPRLARRGVLQSHATIIYTPPARVEWLEVLG